MRRSRLLQWALVAACMAAVAWGALAFGAVYPWAYRPLATACGAIGIVALATGASWRPPLQPLALGLAAIGLAIGLQLVPLSLPVLNTVSPGAGAFLSQYDLAYQAASAGAGEGTAGDVAQTFRHPISIAPAKTLLGGLLFAAFALFLLGISRLISVVGAKPVSYMVIGFGAVLALIGIAQHTLTLGDAQPLIYGFWRPLYPSKPFGPFVNPNHFAGWMLMGLPLALSAFFNVLLEAIDAGEFGKNQRIALTSSPRFGSMLMLGAACLVMGLSLLMTRSRSGLAAFAFGAIVVGRLLFRQVGGRARVAVAVSIALLLAGTVVWAGLDTIVGKFTERGNQGSLVQRVEVWKDTANIIRRFPVAGSGLDTFGTATMLYQTADHTVHFQEAHNDYLQLAAEGGLLLGVPVAITLGLFVRDVRRRFREAPKFGTTYYLRIGAVSGLLSMGLQSLVEFSLQMPGNAAFFAVLCAIALHRSPHLSVQVGRQGSIGR